MPNDTAWRNQSSNSRSPLTADTLLVCYNSHASSVLLSKQSEDLVATQYRLSVVDKVKRSDGAKFSAVFEDYHLQICRYLCRLVNDQELAEDLAQDTFLNAYRSLRASPSPNNMRAWLYRIATNSAMSALRRRRVVTWIRMDFHPMGEFDATQPDCASMVGERDLVTRALNSLKRTDAAWLILHFQHGVGYQELSEIFGVSIPAARMKLSRIRCAFREAYLNLSQEADQ
jgi:RNA polymerase sigma-70 factor, ECF subfamily